MTKGRVVVAKEHGQPFVIEEYDVPDPEPGGIILKITQAGICGSDLHQWRGDQRDTPLPPNGRVMGHEGTGVIAQLGAGVTTDSLGKPIHEGDRLMYASIAPCNRCYQCLRGEHNWCSGGLAARDAGVFPYFVGRTRTTTTSLPTARCSRCRPSCRTRRSGSSTARWER